MKKIIDLPDNFIGHEDREKLESFAGHTIARGRAVRWHWDKTADGDDVLEIYRFNDDDKPDVRITRDRANDAFCAHDADGTMIATGTLEHMLAVLEEYFARLHGEIPDSPA